MFYWYALTAIFIAWIWVDYYRLIDIYEPEKLRFFLLTFLLGGLSVYLVFGINRAIFDGTGFVLNGNLLNDFLYCTIRIGVIEEFAKLSSFAIIYFFFRNQINEPIDYLVYICVGALGFSAYENILYFSRHGADIISGRAILSTVGHMFFASITAYGIIRHKYKRSKLGYFGLLLYFLWSSASHGLYDFWLMFEATATFGIFLTVLFFLEGISIFARILNNALNNSEFFTYKKMVNVDQVANRLLLYYGLVFIMQFAYLVYEQSFFYALTSVGSSFFTIGFIVWISCLRLSRFKLIKGRWDPVILELPFKFAYIEGLGKGSGGYRLRIKGESYNETYLNRFYQEEFYLCPLSKRKSTLKEPKLAFIERKLFLYRDETYFLAKVYLDSSKARYDFYLLKPKLLGRKFTPNKSPIVAVLQISNSSDLENKNLKIQDFKFIEWAYAKAVP